jgi:BRCA1-associated protein
MNSDFFVISLPLLSTSECTYKMAQSQLPVHLYSIIIAIYSPPSDRSTTKHTSWAETEEGDHTLLDWRLGEVEVDYVDFTREKSIDRATSSGSMRLEPTVADHDDPGSHSTVNGNGASPSSRKVVPGVTGSPLDKKDRERKKRPSQPSTLAGSTSLAHRSSADPSDPSSLSLQPLVAHFPGPHPLASSVDSGVAQVGRGVVHLFRHAPPPSLISTLDAHPVGESSKSAVTDGYAGTQAEGEDGSLIAILAVPAWMRPADFLEFIGGWGTTLEGVRMIRWVLYVTWCDLSDG